jgi:hypothetical protein
VTEVEDIENMVSPMTLNNIFSGNFAISLDQIRMENQSSDDEKKEQTENLEESKEDISNDHPNNDVSCLVDSEQIRAIQLAVNMREHQETHTSREKNQI